MVSSVRQRFILRATVGYAVFALIWIYLSDQLLAQFVDVSRILWLSSAKGASFVLVTTLFLYVGLRAVPAEGARVAKQDATQLRQLALLGWSRWVSYGFAVLASVVFLVLLDGIGMRPGERPLLIILMLPIILSAATGGIWPGLCATAICALGAQFFLIQPRFSFSFASLQDVFQWCFLITNGVLVSALCEVLRRAWQQMEVGGQQRSVILGNIGDAIIATDAGGQITYLNPAAEKLTGWSAAAAVGQPLAAVFAPLDESGAPLGDLGAQITGTSERFVRNAVLLDRTQQPIPIHVQGAAVRLDDGACVGLVLVLRDETERRRMEESVRHMNELLENMGALAHVGGWEFDPVTQRGLWTQELANIHEVDLGEHPDVAFGMSFYEGRWRLLLESAMGRLLQDGTPYDLQLESITATGKRKWVRVVATPMYVEGRLVKVRGAMLDLTAQKQAEDALRVSEARYARVIEGSDQGFWELNVQTRQFDISPRFASMLGYSLEGLDISPARWGDYVHPVDLDKAQASIAAHLAGKTPAHQAEMRIRSASGEWKWVLTRGKIVQWDADGKPLIMSGTHTDISERKGAEAALRQAATVFESSQEGVVIADAESMVVRVNAAFVRLTGYSADEVVGKKTLSFLYVSGKEEVSIEEIQAQIAEQGSWQGESWGRRKNGELFPRLMSVSVVCDEHGDVVNYVQVFTDISTLKASEERLDYLAHHDPLTKLPNRLLLFSRLDHALATARRDGGVLALLMFDLDRFKDINDSFGHLVGDSLLQQVASRLSERLRSKDFFARLGGDEFTILLEGLNRLEDAARVAEEVIEALSQPFHLANGVEVQSGASIGISLFPGHGDSAENLLQQADAAMYRVKAEGRGHYQYFSESMTHAARDRIHMDSRLRQALARQEFRVFYQPLVDIASGRIVGAEALVRWLDPEEGLIAPARFIPIAEETGLIREIGAWVLQETCRQGREWLDAGIAPLLLAVNVSGHQIRHGHFGAQVEDVLRTTRFPAASLELELTESTLMGEREEITELLEWLRSQAIRLAIDDFGTGYSSLAYLKRFPLDVLKIDKSFVDDIPHERDDCEITLAIINMAHTLGFKVLAEGVETAEQLAFLQAHGCDLYQGYYRSKPVPAEAFVKLLQG